MAAPAGNPRLVAASLLALCLATPARSQAAGAHLVEVRGQVLVRSPRGAEVAAVTGAVLPSGARLRTGSDGAVVLALDEGSIVRVAPASSLLLQHGHTPARRQQVVVPFGRLSATVRSGEGELVVATPTAACSVRGTELEVQVADDGAVRVLVREGSVAVDADTGQTLVEAGQQLEVDERSMSLPVAMTGLAFERWHAARAERLRTHAAGLVDSLAARLTARLGEVDALAAAQRDVATRRDATRVRLARAEAAAPAEVSRLERRLTDITAKLELVGALVTAELGHAAHLQDLAVGPLVPALAPRLRDKAALVQAVRERVEAALDESGRALERREAGRLPAGDAGEAPATVPVPGAGVVEADRAAVTRLRDVAGRMSRHLEEAREARDVLELRCVDARLAVARALLEAAVSAEAALLGAVSRRDGEAAAHQHEKITVARARGDRLLVESEACVGERALYTGETRVEHVTSRPEAPATPRGGAAAAGHP